MNDNDPFEQRLRRQPLRPVPSAWREEILAAAKATQRSTATPSVSEDQAALLVGWRLLLGRLPVAWASLAALWIALIGVNLMMPSPMVRLAEPGSPSAQIELLAALDWQPAGIEPSSDQPSPASRTLPATKRPVVPVRPHTERRRGADFDAAHSDSLFDLIA
jgi:hypothetical protein